MEQSRYQESNPWEMQNKDFVVLCHESFGGTQLLSDPQKLFQSATGDSHMEEISPRSGALLLNRPAIKTQRRPGPTPTPAQLAAIGVRQESEPELCDLSLLAQPGFPSSPERPVAQACARGFLQGIYNM